jgi:hypothetical protein
MFVFIPKTSFLIKPSLARPHPTAGFLHGGRYGKSVRLEFTAPPLHSTADFPHGVRQEKRKGLGDKRRAKAKKQASFEGTNPLILVLLTFLRFFG